MPPLPHPGARTVRFDDAVAADCSRRFDALADRLDAIARTAWDRTGACTAEWRGPSRAWFDDADAAMLDRLLRAAATARGAAEMIRRNVAVAAARQLDLNDQARRAAEIADARLAMLAAGSGQP